MLPKNNIFLGYPLPSMLADSYVKLPGKVWSSVPQSSDMSCALLLCPRLFLPLTFSLPSRSSQDTYDILASAHSVYDRPSMTKLVPNAFFITLLRDPAVHFISSWNYWHTTEHIKRTSNQDVTMDQFLNDPVRGASCTCLLEKGEKGKMEFGLDVEYSFVLGAHITGCGLNARGNLDPLQCAQDKYLQMLTPGDIKLLHNSMTYDLGVANPTPENVRTLTAELMNNVSRQ